jgi:hypothetical protein
MFKAKKIKKLTLSSRASHFIEYFFQEKPLPSKQKTPEHLLNDHKAPAGKATEVEVDELSDDQRSDKNQDNNVLTLRLSNTLIRKLLEKARIEGVKIDDLATELLAEGLVLRAWEIMEKKGAMRGPSQHPGPNVNNNRGSKFGFRTGGNNHSRNAPTGKGGGRGAYKNIMEDNANFLEYVRSQEKKF